MSHVEAGTVAVATLFTRGLVVDLTLLAGGLAVGALLGVAAGRVCAARPRSSLARALIVVLDPRAGARA